VTSPAPDDIDRAADILVPSAHRLLDPSVTRQVKDAPAIAHVASAS
jgi:hypothetical protein